MNDKKPVTAPKPDTDPVPPVLKPKDGADHSFGKAGTPEETVPEGLENGFA